ncbi:PASTA domain-containing protein [Microbacterium sp. zg.Y625]|uniref:PASTA domain-containing protein n=1 Tax=Microbacterium jiangjiandongii TaxID=3049071 RepID=UPI00214BF4D2|nr:MULTISPECIES: PASTA domain-containing protein [unclassified Microbacterium]MCR2792318.1 PASTA domain-containing protein [Microbacterium sp. zg.Y625]WIM25113.1 PASTA domain-containing protein [Microbacterium sp. zg-Y625]
MSGGQEFGPTGPAAPGGPPFAVAGPSAVSLDAARSGLASFTVSNVTGRPVRARVMVIPGAGADPAWFRISGDAERSLPVAGTATVEVAVHVATTAPAGESSFTVGAALEEAPDQVVSGPTVAFRVPDPVKRRFPWLWVIVAVVAVLVLAGGGILIWILTRTPAAPTAVEPPAISGALEVGTDLAVEQGTWDPDDVVKIDVWQACPASATDEDDADCEDILVGEGEDATPAQGHTFVVGAEVVGRRIRVIETAVRVDPETFGEDGTEDLSDLPHASAPSAMTDPVPPAAPTTAVVPDVLGLSYRNAQATLADSGFQIRGIPSNEVGECNPKVEAQDPAKSTEAPIGSDVVVFIDQSPPIRKCFVFGSNLDDIVIAPDRIIPVPSP